MSKAALPLRNLILRPLIYDGMGLIVAYWERGSVLYALAELLTLKVSSEDEESSVSLPALNILRSCLPCIFPFQLRANVRPQWHK